MLDYLKIAVEFAKVTIRNYLISTFELGHLRSDRKYIEIDYHDGEERYTIRFKRRRGPSKIHLIMGYRVICGGAQSVTDITEEVKRYMGPCHNFHNVPTSPKDLNYSKIVIEFIDGSTSTFEENDLISI